MCVVCSFAYTLPRHYPILSSLMLSPHKPHVYFIFFLLLLRFFVFFFFFLILLLLRLCECALLVFILTFFCAVVRGCFGYGTCYNMCSYVNSILVCEYVRFWGGISGKRTEDDIYGMKRRTQTSGRQGVGRKQSELLHI